MKHYCINLKGLLPDELTLNKGYWKIRQVYNNVQDLEKRIFGKWGLVKMKLWEVLKELEENRDKKYKMVSRFGKIHEIGLDNNGYYAFSSIFDGKNIDDKPSGGFSGNVHRGADWQEVKQPVPWQEAIEAWANWKTIKCVHYGENYVFEGRSVFLATDEHVEPSNVEPSKKMILDGTWYIED